MKENEIFAAIAMALHEHNGSNMHDKESGKITISKHTSEWNKYSLWQRMAF